MEDLYESNKYLIYAIAKKFYGVEKEDLIQAGCLGLINAIKNYNNPNTNFSSYAYKYIFGEMYELSLRSRDIKLNKYYFKLFKLINLAKEKLTQEFNREATLKDISSYLEIEEDELELASRVSLSILSLDSEYETIEFGVEENIDNTILINDSLNTLDSLSSEVIKKRYFSDYSQEETAKILGISQSKVSRIEKRAKSKIYEYIS